MKEQIEQHLQQLIGLVLSSTTRAANMECLKFGHLLKKNKEGREIEIGEFGLHLQCPWRFTSDTGILVGSDDLYEPINETSEYNDDFDWNRPNGNLRDFKLAQVLNSNDLLVTAAVADHFGGFTLVFSNSIQMSVFPVTSKVDRYSEHWRLLANRSNNKYHLVVSNSGVRQD